MGFNSLGGGLVWIDGGIDEFAVWRPGGMNGMAGQCDVIDDGTVGEYADMIEAVSVRLERLWCHWRTRQVLCDFRHHMKALSVSCVESMMCRPREAATACRGRGNRRRKCVFGSWRLEQERMKGTEGNAAIAWKTIASALFVPKLLHYVLLTGRLLRVRLCRLR